MGNTGPCPGHGVTLVARREDKLRELAAELADQVRVNVEAVIDLTSRAVQPSSTSARLRDSNPSLDRRATRGGKRSSRRSPRGCAPNSPAPASQQRCCTPGTVAEIGVDALDSDSGDVIAGIQNVISTRLFQLLPNKVLLPLLASQHPALKRDTSRR